MIKHHKNLGDLSNKNVFVVGDIHGEYFRLIRHLYSLGFDFEKGNDILLSVGDLVDRGQYNLETIAMVPNKWFDGVRGNHDDLMIRSIMDDHPRDLWEMNGGTWARYYDKDCIGSLVQGLIDKLPYTLEFTHHGKKILLSHAAFSNDMTVQEVYDPAQIRTLTINRSIHHNGSPAHPDFDYLIHGHTYNENICFDNNRIYIDTGAVFGKSMSFIKFDNKGRETCESFPLFD